MLISTGNALGGGSEFSSVPGLSGCCPVPVTPSRSSIVNWKMDPVGLPASNTAPTVLPAALPLSPSGQMSQLKQISIILRFAMMYMYIHYILEWNYLFKLDYLNVNQHNTFVNNILTFMQITYNIFISQFSNEKKIIAVYINR